MGDRVVKFKTSVVGGFDRQDVISYIKVLSGERNELRVKLAERRASEEEARREIYKSHRREFESAEDVLHALEVQHEEIGKQIHSLREHLKTTRELVDAEKPVDEKKRK